MTNFEKAIAKIIRENEEAEAKGMEKGRADTIFQAVKKMLKRNVQDEDIMEYMDITKEELEKLKLQMA